MQQGAFLTGWEAGGHTVWALALRHPDRWRGVADKNMEQFRQPGKQVVLYPAPYKTGDVVAPFEKARGK